MYVEHDKIYIERDLWYFMVINIKVKHKKKNFKMVEIKMINNRTVYSEKILQNTMCHKIYCVEIIKIKIHTFS